MSAPPTTDLRWDPPGPGTWELDSSHCGPAPGPILRGIYEHALNRGMAEGMALFGSPLKSMEMRWVRGKFYRRLVPLVGANSNAPAPPKPVLWLATRLHPAFRRNERRAAESFATKRWRGEIARWEAEWKPSLVERNLALTDVDPAALDDGALAAHLRGLYAHVLDSATLHFRLHVSDMGPLGLLMVRLEDWGLDGADSFHALVAASPATREPAARLRDIADAVRDGGGDPVAVTTLDDIRATPKAAELLDAYLRVHGWRLTTGYDLEDRCLAELPGVVAASVRGAALDRGEDLGASALDRVAALRERVPAEHRAEFDDVVEDARLSYGLRDENGPLTYEWPAGLLRRAVLEAGARLAAAGALPSAADVFELSIDEIASLLDGGDGPSVDEVVRRAAERREWASLQPPLRLGREEGPPPVSVMPEHLGLFTRVVLTVVASLEADPGAEPLHGLGIGSVPYRGTARVVHDAEEAFAKVEPGDVIITPYTAPTYNAVLSLAGAIVTAEGGLLCHAAVIARELGIPAVVGASGAMDRIPDGAIVEIDPGAGAVRVVE